MLVLMKRRWFLIIDYYNETKLLGVSLCVLLVNVCVCGRQVEEDNQGYSEVHVIISSFLILQHEVFVQQTCLTTEEEALWETVLMTVCSIFAMATVCPALVTRSSWNKLCIEGK